MPQNDTVKSPGEPSRQPPDTRLKFRLPRLGCFPLFFLFFFAVGGALMLLFCTTFALPIECETPTEPVTVSDPCNILHEADREILTELANEVAKEGACSVAVYFVDEHFEDFHTLFDAVLTDWSPEKGVLVMCGLQEVDTYSRRSNLKMALAGGGWRLAGSNLEKIHSDIMLETRWCKANAVRILLADLKQSLERAKTDDLPECELYGFSGVYFDSRTEPDSPGFRYTAGVVCVGLGIAGLLIGLLIWGIGRDARKHALATIESVPAEFERRRPNEPELELVDRNQYNKSGISAIFEHPVLKTAAILLGSLLAAVSIIGGMSIGPESDSYTIKSSISSSSLDIDEIREAPDGIVVDLADAFSPEEERVLAETVDHLEKNVGGQVRILTIKSLGNNELEDYTLEVASRWKIGEAGKDNGALLFLAIDDRRNRIEVGYGWEGSLTDARCGDLLRAAVPELREERYADACVKIVQGMEKYLAESPVIDPSRGLAQTGIVFNIPSIELPVPAWDPRKQSLFEAFSGIFGMLLVLLGVALGYLGRICQTSQPDYVIIDPAKIRKSLSYGSSSGGSSYSRSSSRSSHRSSGGSRRSGGGGSFGGGGASGRW